MSHGPTMHEAIERQMQEQYEYEELHYQLNQAVLKIPDVLALLQDEADDRAKQRRYMRFNLVFEIEELERRTAGVSDWVRTNEPMYDERQLVHLRAELALIDELWPDTAAPTTVQS